MGVLKDAGGSLLGSNQKKVDGFVRDIFGEEEEGGRLEWERVYPEWHLQDGTLKGMVLKAIQGTSNESRAGPDGIGYRQIKLVLGTRLSMELVELIVDRLRRGLIPAEWKVMKMVIIPKPGRDLTLTNFFFFFFLFYSSNPPYAAKLQPEAMAGVPDSLEYQAETLHPNKGN